MTSFYQNTPQPHQNHTLIATHTIELPNNISYLFQFPNVSTLISSWCKFFDADSTPQGLSHEASFSACSRDVRVSDTTDQNAAFSPAVESSPSSISPVPTCSSIAAFPSSIATCLPTFFVLRSMWPWQKEGNARVLFCNSETAGTNAGYKAEILRWHSRLWVARRA